LIDQFAADQPTRVVEYINPIPRRAEISIVHHARFPTYKTL
jgi:hypothetical protein